MADVDISAASSRESLDEMLYQARYCPTLIDADWQEWRATLRALHARATQAEAERDAARAALRKIATCTSHHPNDVVAVARAALGGAA